MKMRDVFDLPLEYAGMCFQDQSGNCFGGNDYERESEVVKAINNHDALVELNKELVEALIECMHLMHRRAYEKAAFKHKGRKLIAKAKELTND